METYIDLLLKMSLYTQQVPKNPFENLFHILNKEIKEIILSLSGRPFTYQTGG